MKHLFTLTFLISLTAMSVSDSYAQKQRIQQLSTGTGFFVSVNGDLVTNHHVIEQCQPGTISVRNQGYNWVPATLKATDAQKDLAILKAQTRFPKVASLEAVSSGIRVGDSVVVLGYPGKRAQTGEYKFVKSDVRWVGDTQQLGNIIEFRNVVAKGNSGGPLLDQTGNVIGVVTGYFYGRQDETKNNAFAVSLKELKNFLRKNKVMVRRSVQRGNRSDTYVERRSRDFIVSVRCVVSEKYV